MTREYSLWFNPRSSTARKELELLGEQGAEPALPLQRPILAYGDRAVAGRAPERVLELLGG